MPEQRGVCYQISGCKHLTVLLVSIHTLRKFWSGPVTLLVGDDAAWEVAKQMMVDPRLDIECKRFERSQRSDLAKTHEFEGKVHAAYLDKTKLRDLSPYSSTLFLDADTQIVGKFDEMFPIDNEIVITSFSNWNTYGKRIGGRVESWRPVAPEYVEHQLSQPWPAINTGVFAFTKETDIFEPWMRLTERHPVFIADEIAMQLLFPHYKCRVMGDGFNWSPTYGIAEDVRIIHHHGKKHVKKPKNLALWWQPYTEVMELNLANVQDWSPGADRRLRHYLDKGGTGEPVEW